MTSENPEAALRAELQDVDTDISELRRTAGELRRQVTEGWSEPMDAPERAALLTAAEEQEALAESLETRRASLRKALGDDES